MKANVKLLVLLLAAAAPLVSLADDQLSCVKDVTYSPQFLKRYPTGAAACREVVMKDGQKWVRFDANVVKVDGNKVTADFKDKFNNTVATLTIEASPDARAEINGRDTRISDLARGDELSFWMPASRLEFYSSAGGSGSQKFAVVDTGDTGAPR